MVDQSRGQRQRDRTAIVTALMFAYDPLAPAVIRTAEK
jgi:hypothetical protein